MSSYAENKQMKMCPTNGPGNTWPSFFFGVPTNDEKEKQKTQTKKRPSLRLELLRGD